MEDPSRHRDRERHPAVFQRKLFEGRLAKKMFPFAEIIKSRVDKRNATQSS